jgi:hypothetical protein
MPVVKPARLIWAPKRFGLHNSCHCRRCEQLLPASPATYDLSLGDNACRHTRAGRWLSPSDLVLWHDSDESQCRDMSAAGGTPCSTTASLSHHLDQNGLQRCRVARIPFSTRYPISMTRRK